MINPIGIHRSAIKMNENERFDEFMDRLDRVLKKFEKVIYRDNEMMLYRKEIISREDIFKEKKVTHMDEDCVIQYVVRERVKILLKYRFVSL